KKPGSQKLTPPSSAIAPVGTAIEVMRTNAHAKAPMLRAPLDHQLFHVRPHGSMPVSRCRDQRLEFVARWEALAVSARAGLHLPVCNSRRLAAPRDRRESSAGLDTTIRPLS